jgi:hypothetical protein
LPAIVEITESAIQALKELERLDADILLAKFYAEELQDSWDDRSATMPMTGAPDDAEESGTVTHRSRGPPLGATTLARVFFSWTGESAAFADHARHFTGCGLPADLAGQHVE